MTSKDIEEKAILSLKNYIWGSKVLSQFIAENDKEPFWDGYVNLYKDLRKIKNLFLGVFLCRLKVNLYVHLRKKSLNTI